MSEALKGKIEVLKKNFWWMGSMMYLNSSEGNMLISVVGVSGGVKTRGR